MSDRHREPSSKWKPPDPGYGGGRWAGDWDWDNGGGEAGGSSGAFTSMRSGEIKDLEGSTDYTSKAQGSSPSDIPSPTDVSEVDDESDHEYDLRQTLDRMEMGEEKYPDDKYGLLHTRGRIETRDKKYLDNKYDPLQTLGRMEMGEGKYPKWQLGKSEHTLQLDFDAKISESILQRQQEILSEYYQRLQPEGISKHVLRLQRAWVVHSTWASIENVCKISSGVLVNKLQCEHIANHFKVIANVLKIWGLDKDFVSGEALDGHGGIETNLTFDEMHFHYMIMNFKKRVYPLEVTNFYGGIDFKEFFQQTRIQDVSRMFEDYICDPLVLDGSIEESLFKKSKINKDLYNFSLLEMKEDNVLEEFGDRGHRGLDEFLCLLLGVLKQGEVLMLFHSRLEEPNKTVIEFTGLHGENFIHIHELLYKLLHFYACLDYCKGTEFAEGYLSQCDSCGVQSFLYYLNSNCLGWYESLDIDGDFLNMERAVTISEQLERPSCILKSLNIKSSSWVKGDQEEIRKCRLLVIVALSKCVSIRSVIVHGSNGEEVHELYKSLSVNMDLENLVISSDEALADNNAMHLSTMLKEKHNLKSFTLEFKGLSFEGIVYLGAMLVENSSLKKMNLSYRVLGGTGLKHLMKSPKANIEPRVCISLSVDGSLMVILELPFGAIEIIAQILNTNKTLTHFSIDSMDSNPNVACEILDFLKKNKTLQVLDLEEFKDLEDARVKIAFMDLLVNHNFTLDMIKMHQRNRDIETFIKCELERHMRMGDLWSIVDGTLESPIVHNAHDLKQAFQTLQLEEGEGSTKIGCGSSVRAFDKHKLKVETKDERPRLFLSYSSEMRDFAMQLCVVLKSSNYNVFDQDSIEALDQCQLAIVVLSNKYVSSKSSMLELNTILKSKRKNNPSLKVYPLFYKLTQRDLRKAYSNASAFGGEGISLDNGLRKEALKFLIEGKNEVSKKACHLVHNLRQGRIDVGKFCEQFNEVLEISWPCNGLEFEKSDVFEEGYVQAILEEIFHYMPSMNECNNDQISRHQGKLEIKSKLSLRQMKPLLESILISDFYLQRKLNMAQYLQEKYIQYSSFEKMCPFNLTINQKHEYSKGRIVAALFPKTFLYHFKVQLFRGPPDGNFLPMLKAVAELVAQMMQQEINKNGVQTSTFFDFVDYGAPLDAKRMIARCQNFLPKTSNGSKQLVIVQDNLIGVYYYQYIEASNFENLAIDETIGVIGVQVASTEIYVDNIQEDGSSYSGVLGDFSYKFDSDKNKQCAAKAFGDLAGARFLSKKSGIKCSPLLIIALASAIQKIGLTLTWSKGKGHMEFKPKLALKEKVAMEACACQIQYTSNVNQLGQEIEWGADIEDVGTVSGSSTLDHIGLYGAASQYRRRFSFGLKIAGNGFDIGFEKLHSKAKAIVKYLQKKIFMRIHESEGGYYIHPNLHVEYPNLENHLRRCQLHEVDNCNYLVVSNVKSTGHVSIYSVEQNEVVPKFELVYITDILVGGERDIELIFETGLKGRELTVRRDGSKFSHVGNPSKPLESIVPGYQECLLKVKSKHSNKDITSSMVQILEPSGVGRLKSKNEWEHLIGPQADFRASHKFWWNASPMAAIVYSRTLHSSGKLLETRTESPSGVNCPIGFCSIEDPKNEFGHKCPSIISRGKFSRPPGLLSGKNIFWGGYEIEHVGG